VCDATVDKLSFQAGIIGLRTSGLQSLLTEVNLSLTNGYSLDTKS